MYINNENFEKWMEKLSKKLFEIGQKVYFPTLPLDGKHIIEPLCAHKGMYQISLWQEIR